MKSRGSSSNPGRKYINWTGFY